MVELLLATAFSASFGLLIRRSQRRGLNLWAVGAANYVTASVFHTIRSVVSGPLNPSPSTLWIGAVGGMGYACTFVLVFSFMARRGVSITTAIMRLGVVIPVLASILLWGEYPTYLQGAGALLAICSLPLLTIDPRGARSGLDLDKRGLGILVLLFLGNGLCSLSVRGFRQTNLGRESALFLAILFGTAATVAVIGWLTHREGSSRRDLLPGVLLGLCNALANQALVASLQHLPGILVFPFYSAIGVVLTAVFARAVWAERIRRLEVAGMGIALVATVLINV